MPTYGYGKRKDLPTRPVPAGEPESRITAPTSAETRRTQLAADAALGGDADSAASYGANANRWGADAEDEWDFRVLGYTPQTTYDDVPIRSLAAAGLAPGGRMSVSVEMYQFTGTGQLFAALKFFKADRTAISQDVKGSALAVGGSGALYQVWKWENVTIPAEAAYVLLCADPPNGTGTQPGWRARKIMLVSEATVPAFAAPSDTGDIRRVVMDRAAGTVAAAEVLAWLAGWCTRGRVYRLRFQQTSAGGQTVTWPASNELQWDGATAVQPAAGADAVTLYELLPFRARAEFPTSDTTTPNQSGTRKWHIRKVWSS